MYIQSKKVCVKVFDFKCITWLKKIIIIYVDEKMWTKCVRVHTYKSNNETLGKKTESR